MNYLLTLGLTLGSGLLGHLAAAPTPPAAEKYLRTPTGFLLVLHPGDDVLRELTQLAEREKIPGASLTGLGFVHPTFGFWNKQTKTYDPKSFRDTELASLTGSLAWQDGKPALHLHGVVTDQTFAAYGGHILALEVGTGSVEITVTVHAQRLSRPVNPQTGAAVLGW